MKITNLILAFCLIILTSCISKQLVVHYKDTFQLDNLHLKTVIKNESRSKDITPKHKFGLGKNLYPNKKNYVLGIPQIYEIYDKPIFNLKTNYFYSEKDSLVKVILYEWIVVKHKKDDFFEDENYEKNADFFQLKFDSLANFLYREFGNPIVKNIEHITDSDKTYRDDLKFKRADGLNAYLFMFKRNINGYREIRLVVYKD
ncbi:hypothetical protein [Sphingobacterium cellulitidis]|uniref:Lipoprotein n=1 Tax=Sphingobacterium cellulitidis TaxID=1768011 RepID=A0A8H9FXG5_9SPHI|nr:hypothetical protein [Sphingobacterium soli]MBA8986951.1 hypothetical protein [Sphingobacterium soli]GGE15136.1 hypothetical protein GCM10011516_11190 [Sphingobacterium soli]